jgi:hypothetical protein
LIEVASAHATSFRKGAWAPRQLPSKRPPPETGFSGDAFWASFIIFPTEGCWEVTGKVEASRLTFVTLVVKA